MSTEIPKNSISVIVRNDVFAGTLSDSSPQANFRGWKDVGELAVKKIIDLPTERLSAQFEQFLSALTPLLEKVQTTASAFALEEIELTAEISAEGRIELIGSVATGAKGGITFKLRRRPAAPSDT